MNDKFIKNYCKENKIGWFRRERLIGNISTLRGGFFPFKFHEIKLLHAALKERLNELKDEKNI